MNKLFRRLLCWLNVHGAAESRWPLYGGLAGRPLTDHEYKSSDYGGLYRHTCRHCGRSYYIGQ